MVHVVIAALFAALPAQDKPAEQALKKLADKLSMHLKAADADENGTISRSEFAAFEKTVRREGEALLDEIDPSIAKKKAEKDLKKYDSNGDGSLDEAETKAMEEARRLKEIKDFDWDEDGQLSEREKTAMQWAEEGRLDGFFKRLDTDGKGELNEERLKAALGVISRLKKK